MSQDRTYKPRTGRPRINTEYIHVGIGPVERRKLEKLKPLLPKGKGTGKDKGEPGDAKAVRYLINTIKE
jgi:hypothetical protein